MKGKPHLKVNITSKIPIRFQNPMTTKRTKKLAEALCRKNVLNLHRYRHYKRLKLSHQMLSDLNKD